MTTNLKLLLAAGLLGLSGCAGIPDADVAFVNRSIDIGMSTETAQYRIERRGFTQIETRNWNPSVFNEETQSFDELPFDYDRFVQQNLGFVKMDGQPSGKLSCFVREYVRFFAAGDRIICWTADDSGNVTWRQASWRGAGL